MNRALRFTLLGLALVVIAAGCGSKSEQTACVVKVFFAMSATQSEIDAVGTRLDENAKVASFKFVSKEVALKQMKERYPKLVEKLKYNPLPDTFEVVPTHVEDDRVLKREFTGAPGVDGVRGCPTRFGFPLP
jgi:cell division protein FtsX